MSWIKEAEEAGRAHAEEVAVLAKKRAKFNAEPVSEEKVAAILEEHQAPILPLVEDLIKTGYKVKREGPGYLHHSYQGEPGSKEELGKFTLTRVVESPGWGLTDYSKWERQVYSIEWQVSRKGSGEYDQLLGTISIYPTIDDETHYAGVQYRATAPEYFSKPQIADSADITGDLQQEVRRWITRASLIDS